jgi:hypothetical protein
MPATTPVAHAHKVNGGGDPHRESCLPCRMATVLRLRVDQLLRLMGQRLLLLVLRLPRTSSSSTKPLPIAMTLMSLAMEIIVMLPQSSTPHYRCSRRALLLQGSKSGRISVSYINFLSIQSFSSQKSSHHFSRSLPLIHINLVLMMRTRAVWPRHRPFLQRNGSATARINARCVLAIHWITWRKNVWCIWQCLNNSSECFIYRDFNFHFLDLEAGEMCW